MCIIVSLRQSFRYNIHGVHFVSELSSSQKNPWWSQYEDISYLPQKIQFCTSLTQYTLQYLTGHGAVGSYPLSLWTMGQNPSDVVILEPWKVLEPCVNVWRQHCLTLETFSEVWDELSAKDQVWKSSKTDGGEQALVTWYLAAGIPDRERGHGLGCQPRLAS